MTSAIEVLSESHPCFNEQAHSRVGRIHLPVAPKCNIQCKFCDIQVGEFYHSSRPGLAERIIQPKESIQYIREAVAKNPVIKVLGIAGPGEPLYNESTFETLELVRTEFPNLKLCVCTNGLLLPEKIDQLKELSVTNLTITINAIDPLIGEKINDICVYHGQKIQGRVAAKLLIDHQLAGLERAVALGMHVKVNSILIPDINMLHMPEIAAEIKRRGAHLLNIMPLIPLGGFRKLDPPTCDDLKKTRELCEDFIPIFRLCVQCRADACGIPGLDELRQPNKI